MRSYHPIHDGVDRELLLLVDDHVEHGDLRYWAGSMCSAVDLCAQAGRDRIDEEIASNIFAVLRAVLRGGVAV